METWRFLKRVKEFLKTHNMSPSTFGRKAAGDPRFLRDLYNGREPREATKTKVLAFMDNYNAS